MLSLQFWINLFIAFLVLVFALVAINHSKISFIRKIRASRLRARALQSMNAILPVIRNAFSHSEADLFPMFKLRADLELVARKADLLFDVEKRELQTFLTLLSSCVSHYESGVVTKQEVGDVVLLAQRVIREMSELS